MNLFLGPGANGNAPQGFRATPYVPKLELNSRHTWTRVADIPNAYPHIACMVPHALDTIVRNPFFNFQERNIVQMNKMALFLNNTNI